jgi:hypothetical protein
MTQPAKIPGKKLTRQQIKEGLAAVPVEVVLLGAAGARSTKLTPKQKAFAENLAMGKSKAASYRDAYGSKGKPATASRRGQELAQRSAIQAQVEALTLAAEAQKYATPAALRALVIQQLTAHALSDEVKPAQRIKALELLGKVTEVAAFTERREIIKTTDAGSARAALLENLRQALRASAIDAKILEVTPAEGNSVTLQAAQQLDGAAGDLEGDPGRVSDRPGSDPTAPPPPAQRAAHAQPMLSNPHTESVADSELSVATQISLDATDAVTSVKTLTTVTGVTVLRENTDDSQVEGGGGEKNPWDGLGEEMERPPAGNWVEK